MSIGEDPRIRLDALFDQALDLESDAREKFLAELDAVEPALVVELRLLLSLAEAPGLQPRALVEPLWQALFEQASATGGIDAPSPAAASKDTDFDDFRIGVWRAVRTLGRGGMGTVYLVERSEGGFQQHGAMKLLRAGANIGEFSDEFLRRFEQERQILATLNHEGIARLLDGGRDPQGRPYLVMEYVQGEPIDRACDRERLGVDQRVALFVQVAQAVAYAHRNLIAHRDIKPGNILVGSDGRAKLLDFGIAKALADQPIGEEPLTRTALRVFTPDYATPEQVHGQPASTATDVYQLGLLLYELLTGQRAQRVTDTAQRTLEQAICSTEPLRPSERVTDDVAAAAARQTSPSSLRRKLRGDLDNIVLKALRKEPERRYASAIAMVEDLERWRQGRPVRARPETFAYRSSKFVRRHAWAVAASTAIVAMIVGYAVTVTLQADALARERDRAQAEAGKALQVKALVLRLFEGANPEASGSAQLSARELLDRGWTAIERELGGQPDVQIELLDAVGEAYRQLGVYDRAEVLFERSLQIARDESSRRESSQHRLLLARALRSQGRVRGDLGEYAAGEADLRDALARYRTALGANHAEVATTLGDLARLLDLRGEFAGAEAGHREALAMHRRLHGERDLRVAESLGDLGMILRRQADYAGAEPLLSQSLTLRRQLLPAQHPEIAYALTDLAQVRNDLGEYDSAEALYREALASMQTSLGDAHPSVALTMITLARVLKTRRDFDGARDLLLRALAIRREALGERHPSIALNLNDIGQTYLESGDLARAERYYREALDIYSADNPGRSMTVYNLGQVAEKRGDFAGAERQYRAALAGQRKHYGDEHDRVAMQLNRLGIVLYRQGRLDEAEAAMRQALAIYRKRLTAGHQRLAVVLLPLAQLLIERGRAEDAEPLLREALKVRRDAFGENDPRTAEAARALADTARRR
jgi:tetratricopeptide (TPR) repeat protein/predicted Ser/Thr protein kinase